MRRNAKKRTREPRNYREFQHEKITREIKKKFPKLRIKFDDKKIK